MGAHQECKGVCLSSGPAAKTLLGRHTRELIKWEANGCIGFEKGFDFIVATWFRNLPILRLLRISKVKSNVKIISWGHYLWFVSKIISAEKKSK